MSSLLLVGNGFAMLAAAVEIARTGQEVTLLTDGKRLGGHFAGIQIGPLDFDMGMVFFEECVASDSGAVLRSYDPTVRNDWTRFGSRTAAWIRSNIDLTRAPTPECLVERRRVPDYLIANRLDGLKGWPIIPRLPMTDPCHAAQKCKPGVFDTLSYAEAAKFNHGEVWHQRFIEPFVRKVFGVTSRDFLARYHRAAWVPLYFPETLELAALGQPTGLAEYPFWTSANGFAGQLVKHLGNKLEQLRNVSVVTSPLDSAVCENGLWTLTANGTVFQGRRLALGLPPDRAAALLGFRPMKPLPSATVCLLLVTVEYERIRSTHGCTLIVDDSYAAYRLTDHDAVAGLNPQSHRIVLEASPQELARIHPGKTIESALLDELAALLGMDVSDPHDRDAIRILRCVTAQNSLLIPTRDQIAQANQTALLLAEAAPNVVLTGSLLGYGVNSLNDQVVQALKLSEEFE